MCGCAVEASGIQIHKKQQNAADNKVTFVQILESLNSTYVKIKAEHLLLVNFIISQVGRYAPNVSGRA